MPNEEPQQPPLDRPSAGRIYDYLLGGTHNYAVDREFAERQLALLPQFREIVRANRDFLGRAVRFAVESGVRQFVDIGSGLPTQGNVHEVADEVAPGECRVVYVDNEPIAHAHAQILLEDTADPERHRALAADFFDGPKLWRRVVRECGVDPAQPVCLITVALLHFMPPEKQPEETLAAFRSQLAPGSMLVLTHGTIEAVEEDDVKDAGEQVVDNYRRSADSVYLRTSDEVRAFFADFELVEPGLVWLDDWRRDRDPVTDPAELGMLGGVARKP